MCEPTAWSSAHTPFYCCQEEETTQLQLFRASLVKELDLLSEEQLEELSVYVKEVCAWSIYPLWLGWWSCRGP